MDGQGSTGVLPLYELADEFGLTTADALDVCDRAGVVADSGATMLDAADAEKFRRAAAQPVAMTSADDVAGYGAATAVEHPFAPPNWDGDGGSAAGPATGAVGGHGYGSSGPFTTAAGQPGLPGPPMGAPPGSGPFAG